MCTNPAVARQLADRAAGQLFVMDKWRYHPGVALLAELVRDGTLGAIVGLRLRRNEPGSKHRDVTAPWTLLPHDLAIIEELIGSIPPIQDVVADWSANLISGITARLGSDPWVVIESFSRAPRKEREVIVFGTEAVAVLDDGYATQVVLHAQAPDGSFGPIRRLEIAGEMPLLAELREFVGFVAGGALPRAGANDGARHVEIIDELLSRAARVSA